MPVNFKIKNVSIENFRGIKKLEVELCDKVPLLMVGGNNTGKSTVINAIALALKGGGFHMFTPSEFDFFHSDKEDGASEFKIELHFEADDPALLPAVQGVGKPEPVYGIRVSGGETKNQYEHRHVLLDKDGEGILLGTRTPLKEDDKKKYKDHGLGYRKHYARLEEIQQFLPEVWLLRSDNLERSLYHWKTGPLQKLARLLTDRFLKSEWEYKFKNESRRMPETIYTVHEFFQNAVMDFPFWQTDVKPKMERALAGYVGRQATLALRPTIQAIEEWIAQQLAVSFCADASGALTPLQSMGDGWQALVRLAALEVLRDYPEVAKSNIILLYEEPETYLHPHLCRKLRSVLVGLASNGWTVIASTHAPEFVNFTEKMKIVRLWRLDTGKTRGQLLTESLTDAVRFQEKLDEHGTHEFLFANRVVFCEGKDDVFALKIYLNMKGVDLDGLSVTILSIGGIDNHPDYVKASTAMGIPWCALTDEDVDKDGTENAKTKKTREKLKGLATVNDIVPTWKGSLEGCLGLGDKEKATPEWQEKILKAKNMRDISKQFPDFVATCEEIESWILQKKPGKAEAA